MRSTGFDCECRRSQYRPVRMGKHRTFQLFYRGKADSSDIAMIKFARSYNLIVKWEIFRNPFVIATCLPIGALIFLSTAYSVSKISAIILGSLFIIPFIIWIAIAIVLIIKSIINIEWRDMVKYAMSFIILFNSLIPAMKCGDYIHFLLFLPYYYTNIFQNSASDSEPIKFSWNGNGCEEGKNLVFDRSGIAADFAEKTQRGESNIVGDIAYSTYHFIGNFYFEYPVCSDHGG